MEKIILTRVRYCPKCFANDIPKLNTKFVAFGSKKQKYKTYYVDNYGVRGFSPHIYLLDKVVGDTVVYYYACSICNTERGVNKNGYYFYYIPDNAYQKDTMLTKDWNALVMFKDTGYRL